MHTQSAGINSLESVRYIDVRFWKERNIHMSRNKKLAAVALVSLLVWSACVERTAEMSKAGYVLYDTEQEISVFNQVKAGDESLDGADGYGNSHSFQQLAWWGSLYPRTCLKGAMRLVEDTEEKTGSAVPIKIKWKCMDLFQ